MRAHEKLGAALLVAFAAAVSGCASHEAASTTTSTAPTSSTTTTTQVPVVSGVLGSTSSTTTTSTTVAAASCVSSSLQVEEGKSSGALGTIATGFVVHNAGTAPCVLDGYPTIALVPASGTVNPVITHTGSAEAVTVVGGGEAGFVLEYGDEPVDGQTTCPKMTAVDVTLPYAGASSITVPAGFSPCGAPDVRITAVLSTKQYKELVG